jgi:hypothetical protein
MRQPQELIRRLEAEATLPAGDEERFGGYGIMGLPFTSGHVLALRRFPASSIGGGYTSVWHRDPAGNWSFFSDVAPRLSCSRFFGSAVKRSEQHPISLTWTDRWRLRIEVPAAELTWDVSLTETRSTRLLNGVAALLPGSLWRRPTTLAAIGMAAGRLLGAGRMSLFGYAPNGQRFRSNPHTVWIVDQSAARIGGVDFGAPGPFRRQAYLGDFAIPQRGLFVIGSGFFEPYDEVRHLAVSAALPTTRTA